MAKLPKEKRGLFAALMIVFGVVVTVQILTTDWGWVRDAFSTRSVNAEPPETDTAADAQTDLDEVEASEATPAPRGKRPTIDRSDAPAVAGPGTFERLKNKWRFADNFQPPEVSAEEVADAREAMTALDEYVGYHPLAGIDMSPTEFAQIVKIHEQAEDERRRIIEKNNADEYDADKAGQMLRDVAEREALAFGLILGKERFRILIEETHAWAPKMMESMKDLREQAKK